MWTPDGRKHLLATSSHVFTANGGADSDGLEQIVKWAYYIILFTVVKV